MSNDQFNPRVDSKVQDKMEEIWRVTCGSWENCSTSNIQHFLSQCEEKSIDPQFCMNWIQQHSDKIPDWPLVSDMTREWVIEHTSSAVDQDRI
ncbi:hypothetical protein [Evansella tamaricis]|uniref:Uncharacterized protein n=1 Tax=Evansella tamaricis TaxID=2069301 RepID=A0ABS6JL10_9BACI|nr:hypothetical protein [Evansella tamaricis]MBU9713889.1 hypothetical protein [Evansella tamaricis]